LESTGEDADNDFLYGSAARNRMLILIAFGVIEFEIEEVVHVKFHILTIHIRIAEFHSSIFLHGQDTDQS
jgi:hypothetical protein